MSEEYQIINMIHQYVALIGGAIAVGIHYTQKINNVSISNKYSNLEKEIKKFTLEEMDEINII